MFNSSSSNKVFGFVGRSWHQPMWGILWLITVGIFCIFPFKIPKLSDQRIPHVGWCELIPTRNNSLLRNDELNNWVYFVHSYHAVPSNTNLIAANVSYGSEKLTAIIEQDNLLACQFHPEKSGKTGEKLLRRWIKHIQ